MSKSTRMTASDLESLGLVEVEPGVYAPKKKVLTNLERLPYPEFVEELVELSKYYNSNVKIEEAAFIDPKPFNIAAIRDLGSGTKARKESMSMLHKFAVDRVSASNGIFIRGNVASSKNSKTMGFYYEGKGANKKRVPTLVDSPATKKYRKETAADYRKYKDRFLQMAEGKEFPLMVKLTFIRQTIGRFDFGNAQQVVADLMVDNGWIPDDSTEYFCPVFNPTVYYSKDAAGILIEVL